MRWRNALLLALCFSLAPAQSVSPENQRKVVHQVPPAYPSLAQQMNIEGTVRLEVTVAPNGVVKKINVLGGSPILVQAAQSAIVGWKWEPRAEQTTESVQINFHPN